MKKSYVSYISIAVAAGAIAFGVMHGHGHAEPSNTAWLSSLNNDIKTSHSSAADGLGQNPNLTGSSNLVLAANGTNGLSAAQPSPSNLVGSTTGIATKTAKSSPASARTDVSTRTPSNTTADTSGAQTKGIVSSANQTTNSAAVNSSTSSPSNNGVGNDPAAGTFTIVISEDKGAKVLETKKVKMIPGETLMQYMHQQFSITTMYGDAFIVSIDGIKSQWTGVPVATRQPVDWFLYVNTQEALAGPADITPHAGDVDDWDYHRWDPSTGQG